MKSFYIHTFGCKLNQTDSAAIRAALTAGGMSESSDPEEADLIVVNTCTVTGRADRHARQAIRRLRRQAPTSKLVVTGCYVQRSGAGLSAMPDVDRVFGLEQRAELIGFATGEKSDAQESWPFDPETDFGSRTRAFLKIQEGCDYSCAYCIVRTVRGRSRSLPLRAVVDRLRALGEHGYAEVVLTGIHLGLWGCDTGEGNLADLLKTIDEDHGMPRIRLCSLEPYEVNEDLLRLISGSQRIAHHLHLAVQSGSAEILEAMRRPPHPDEIRRTVELARELMPECGIGADVIVGFPGESDQDFEATASLLAGAPFTYAHVFAFSPRPGTEAAGMTNRVHPETIKNRSVTLRSRMAEKNYRFRLGLVGNIVTAVVIKKVDETGRRIALTDNYVRVSLETDDFGSAGSLCSVMVTAATREETSARVVPKF